MFFRFAPAVILVVLISQSAYATTIFRGTFEDEGHTPVRGAVVELRDSVGAVKTSTITDEWASFRPFATTAMQTGDVIVVYGGIWNDRPFSGEFRLLVDAATIPQQLDPITTLVTDVANSSLISGQGVVERLANAVTFLTDFGLVDSDWRAGSPSLVSPPLQDAIDDAGGIQNWSASLLADLADGDLDPSWMVTFPHVHGGVARIDLPQDTTDWMTGESGRFLITVDTTLPTPIGGWSYSLLEGPAWVSVTTNGELEYSVPAGLPQGDGTARLRVLNNESNRYRHIDLPYRTVVGTVLAQGTYGALGGTLWTPDNSIGVQLADGTFSESTDVQWVSYQDAEGENIRLLRTQPRDRTFLQPPVLLTPGNEGRATERGGMCPSELQSQWDEGWFCKDHTLANFVSGRLVFQGIVSPVVDLNRLPIGSQAVMPAQQAAQLSVPETRTASTFGALCDQDCANRVPVLFIHGYTLSGKLGGGSGTWGDLPATLNGMATPSGNIAAYEFRYRSNARFQDIAADLGAAIEAIYSSTANGNKIHIVAHSFGGLVARTYLQGLATNSQPISLGAANCEPSRHPFVASLLTLGSPHSGIAASPHTVNDSELPDGRQGPLGAAIGRCGQLTCWQAGEPNPFDRAGAGVFKDAYGVNSEFGWLPAELARFGSVSPPLYLPAPTLVMLGLEESLVGTEFAEGDGLISYQGQRFAPALSCANGACSDGTISSTPFTSVGNHVIGNCVYERVLGSVDSMDAPRPGRWKPRQTIYPQYVHVSAVSVSEAEFDSTKHLDDGDVQKSRHDSPHRILDWILRQNPDPGTHRLRLTVTGNGSVEIDNGGTLLPPCTGVPGGPATVCDYTVQPNIRFRMPSGAQYAPRICSGDANSWCDWRVGAYEHLHAFLPTPGYATVSVNVSGIGQVRVQPLDQLCLEPQCIYQFPLNPPGYSKGSPMSAITLSREEVSGGVWNQWSGACAGDQADCSLTLASTSVPQSVTASFSASSQAKLTANDGELGDYFGWAVGISGETALFGAMLDDIGANGDSQGSAYAFTRNGSIWTQQAKLVATDGENGENLGWSVALSGDTALVGRYKDSLFGSDQGAAYVFTRNGGTWTQQARLLPDDGAQFDYFGFSVAIFGDTVIVGSYADDIGTNLNQGAAYVFTRSGATWTQQAKLVANDGAADDYFGHSVAIIGDTVLVGSYADDVGANSQQGSAYVFTRSGNTWTQQAKLIADDGSSNALFGTSVALFGDYGLVGAWGDESAYVFTRSGSTWTQQAKLTANDGNPGDGFGWSVALSGNAAVVGAHTQNVGANSDQGSAYVFVRGGDTWIQQNKLTAYDGAPGQFFGIGVAIQGDTVLVGAPGVDAGAAYVFDLSMPMGSTNPRRVLLGLGMRK